MDNIKRAIKTSAFLIAMGAITLMVTGRLSWAIGLAVGAIWSAINIVATINILKISVLKKDPKKLSALILIKFPVLYLAGFLILSSRAFPIASLLTGLAVVIIIMGIFELWLKQA